MMSKSNETIVPGSHKDSPIVKIFSLFYYNFNYNIIFVHITPKSIICNNVTKSDKNKMKCMPSSLFCRIKNKNSHTLRSKRQAAIKQCKSLYFRGVLIFAYFAENENSAKIKIIQEKPLLQFLNTQWIALEISWHCLHACIQNTQTWPNLLPLYTEIYVVIDSFKVLCIL